MPIHAGSEGLFSGKQLSLSDKPESKAAKGAFIDQLNVIGESEQEDNPFTKKKKRFRKAVLQTLICPAGDINFTIVSFEVDLVFAPQVFYCFDLSSSQDERGPPSA